MAKQGQGCCLHSLPTIFVTVLTFESLWFKVLLGSDPEYKQIFTRGNGVNEGNQNCLAQLRINFRITQACVFLLILQPIRNWNSNFWNLALNAAKDIYNLLKHLHNGYSLLMSWSHSKVHLQSSLLWWAWRRLAQTTSTSALCSSTYQLIWIHSLLRRAPEHNSLWLRLTHYKRCGRRRRKRRRRSYTPPHRSSCSYVQYRSLVERHRKLNPEQRLWMLMISAAKLHIVRLEGNLGAKMYYLSFKVSIWKIADAAYNVIFRFRQAWFSWSVCFPKR